MPKILVSYFFCFLFAALITAPTVLHVIDDTIDVSMFFSLSEEEEKGSETVKSNQILSSGYNHLEVVFLFNESLNGIEYFFKTYPKPHLNLISPPPDSLI